MSRQDGGTLNDKLLGEVTSILNGILSARGLAAAVDERTDVFSIDMDSLDRMNFWFCLEERFQVRISTEDLQELSTVGAIVEFLGVHAKAEI